LQHGKLEINKLIKRFVHNTKPMMVEYELTDYGQLLKPVVTQLYKWGAAHRKRLLERMNKA